MQQHYNEEFYCWTHKAYESSDKELETYLTTQSVDRKKLFSLVDSQGITASPSEAEKGLDLNDIDIESVNQDDDFQ